jgi:adenylosuccinate lyase
MEDEDLNQLNALTHLDGRNASKVKDLRNYFSEFSWMRARILVILRWLSSLSEIKILKSLSPKEKRILDNIYQEFSLLEAKKIQDKEKITNHDLRAIELYIKEKLIETKLRDLTNFVNLGLGSEDINNIALRISLKEAYKNILRPALIKLINQLTDFVSDYKEMTMLARTHGQPASVTTLGKEVGLYLYRFTNELSSLNKIKFTGKVAGEVGNYNALQFALPNIDWLMFSKRFISSFDLTPNLFATQINPYDDINNFFDSLKRLNNILLGLAKDIWLYTLLDYLKIVKIEKEVGSSGMPHKVNPLYFEGAEGGLEQANALLEFFSRKLSYSRLQRDFSDSTVRRNIVLAMAYSLLSYQSLVEAFERLVTNETKINQDIESHYEVFSEGIKTVFSLSGDPSAYEKVKTMTRGKSLSKVDLQGLIKKMRLDSKIKKKLMIDSLNDYAGLATILCEQILKEAKQKIKNYRKL